MSLGQIPFAAQTVCTQTILSQTEFLVLLPVPFFEISGVVQVQVFVEAALGARIGDFVLGELPVLVQIKLGERLTERRNLLLGAWIGFARVGDKVNLVARNNRCRLDLPGQATNYPSARASSRKRFRPD